MSHGTFEGRRTQEPRPRSHRGVASGGAHRDTEVAWAITGASLTPPWPPPVAETRSSTAFCRRAAAPWISITGLPGDRVAVPHRWSVSQRARYLPAWPAPPRRRRPRVLRRRSGANVALVADPRPCARHLSSRRAERGRRASLAHSSSSGASPPVGVAADRADAPRRENPELLGRRATSVAGIGQDGCQQLAGPRPPCRRWASVVSPATGALDLERAVALIVPANGFRQGTLGARSCVRPASSPCPS
jgi:hypothetical protein